jgi:hypothetical protein
MRSFFFWIIAAILLIVALPGAIYNYGTVKEVEIVVQDKERVVKISGESVSSYYLVFTDGKTYKNKDTFWHFKFRSSDLQGKLQIGETYTVKVYGWRIGIFSAYPNIVKIIE